MKISILVFNLSSNSIVRTYPIAKVLERHYEVEVIGPVLGDEIFPPYQDKLNYKPCFLKEDREKFVKEVSKVRVISKVSKLIEGDIIYAFKPKFTSFGVGLFAKYLKNLPLILDIEDWETELYYSSSVSGKIRMAAQVLHLNSIFADRLMEPLTKLADEITVVSNFLKNRFGGVKVPHGPDCSYFDPEKYDNLKLRENWDIGKRKVILFTGFARPHKGLEILIQALKMIDSNTIRLMFVGQQTEYLEKLKSMAGDLIISAGAQSHNRIPEFLSLADLIVLPQIKSNIAEAQVPGKIYEAMAMAKPIIATSVSDLPEILEGCGWITEPDDAEGLAKTIRYVFKNPEEAKEKGRKARQKCIEKYGWDAMEKILVKIFAKYEHAAEKA